MIALYRYRCKRYKTKYQFWITGGIALGYLVMTCPTQAQIVPDATLPNNSRVTSSSVITQGNISNITGGSLAGSNLFHSFEEFSVPTGSTAYFNNALGIQNIISRVTGSSISNIDGLLQANGTASLFLLNPNGIIFGPNASLNIGGSFLASTASSLNFADGTQFNAVASQTTPLLTISVPIGLQFGRTAGEIGVLGSNLAVRSEQTLALIGGNVTVEGGGLTASGVTNLAAPGGRIELGSITGSGLANLAATDRGWNLGYESVRNFGEIQLSQQAFVDTFNLFGESGDIQIQGGRVTLQDTVQLSTFSLGNAGNITVRATDSVEVSNGSSLSTSAFGDGGDVSIETARLSVNGGSIFADTYGSGNGGTIDIRVTDSVEVTRGFVGASPFIDTSNSGAVTIRTGKLTVQDSSSVTTASYSTSQGGNVTIETGQLTVQNRSEVSVSGVLDSASAGNINVTADSILLEDNGQITAAAPSGSGGNITLRVRELLLMRRNGLVSTEAGTAEAGEVLISTEAGTIEAFGDGGNITVDADFIVTFPLENSDITANAFTGTGGRVDITTQGIFGIEYRDRRTDTSDITASSEFGVSGTVEINTPDVDPNRGLVELPTDLVDVSGLIAQNCPGGGTTASEQSEFIITGRGGLPPNPNETLSGEAVLTNWVTLDHKAENLSSFTPATNPPTESVPTQIVEAQGWVINNKGEVVLTATAPNATPHIAWMRSADCQVPEPSS